MQKDLLIRNIKPELARIPGRFLDLEKALDGMDPLALRQLLSLLQGQNRKISSLETEKRRFGRFRPGMGM